MGSAPGTLTSMANCLRPVTAASASMRPRGVPMTPNCAGFFRVTGMRTVVRLAAFTASSPYVALFPRGEVTTPARVVSVEGLAELGAAASTSRARAVAAATRIGV